MTNLYQVGGSLAVDAPTYIIRQADRELVTYLEQGDFCYVFNSRQMGKSSLLVQTNQILRDKGWQTAVLDMTMLGSELTTAQQWYWGMISRLWRIFKLQKYVDLHTWSQTKQDISFVQIFDQFVEEILLKYLSESRIIIFIDEIDSILSLDFPTDDFFAFIRFCYNQRATNPIYQRLTFALFGVATPSNLIQDKKRTPFNIGRAINLTGFQMSEALPLMAGFPDWLTEPKVILQEIINWTGGQPFLTQKICRIVAESDYAENFALQSDAPIQWVANLIQYYVINNWESQDQPEHLQTIWDRLNYYQQRKPRLLGIYQQVLHNKLVSYDDSQEQTELILSGLVIRQADHLQVKNRIYAEVFNLDWVNRELEALRPYSQTFTAWLATGQQDYSRLLRGQALKDALNWSQGKSLSDLDYHFLAASTEIDRQEIQQKLEAENAKIIAQQLKEEQQHLEKEKKNNRRQKILLLLTTTAFLIASGSTLLARQAYQRSIISEIKALIDSSQGMFTSQHQLESMVSAIAAKEKLQLLSKQNNTITDKVEKVLSQAIYNNNEFNRLIGHRGSVLTVDISPDDQLIATGSNDKTVKIWAKDGRLLQTLNHFATVHRVVFSADSQKVISAGLDGTIQIWRINGELVKTITAHQGPVWGINVSSDGQYIASASADRTVKIWTIAGELKNTLQSHKKSVWNVAFSPNNQMLASVDVAGQLKLWSVQGELLNDLSAHTGSIWDVAFCSDNLLVTVGSDQQAKLWQNNGQLVRTLETDHAILGTDCQGKYLATSGKNNMATIWQIDGSFIRNLTKHQAVVRDVALTSNGLLAVSASDDGTAKMWQRNQYLMKPIQAHTDTVWSIATSHDSQLFASSSTDNQMKIWGKGGELLQVLDQSQISNILAISFSSQQPIMVTGNNNGEVEIWDMQNVKKSGIQLKKTLLGHQAFVFAVAVSPDGQIIASGSDDQTIKLWNMTGQLLKSWVAHTERIWQIDFSADGKILASASEDGTVKLWNNQGKLISTLKHAGAVWGLDFHPQDHFIITASRDNTLNYWSLDGQLQQSVSGKSDGLTRVAVSPDGQIVATAGVDNTVKLWNHQGKLLKTLSGHQGMVDTVNFTTDNKYIISGGDDGMVIMWDLTGILNLQSLEYACQWVKDYLENSTEVTEEQKKLCVDVIN